MKDSEERLNKIESKYLFQEDSLEKLSKELRTQQIEIQKNNTKRQAQRKARLIHILQKRHLR